MLIVSAADHPLELQLSTAILFILLNVDERAMLHIIDKLAV